MTELGYWWEHRLTGAGSTIGEWFFGDKNGEGHFFAIIVIILVGTVAYLLGSRLVAHFVSRTIHTTRQREWHKKDIEKRQKTLVALFVNIWKIAVCLVTFYAIAREVFPDIDKNLAPLFASAGIVGVALGFGAQSVIKDFLSGIFIISENQYRVGDIVDIEGASGTVERIGTRSTIIRDVDGNVHYFPNGMITHVINKTMGYSMARFTVALDPLSDIDKVITLINRVGKELAEEEKWKSKIIEPPAFVSIGDLTGLSVEIIIAGKTQPSDQWSVVAEMRRRLLEEFEKHAIKLAVIPGFPVQEPAKKK